MGSCPFSLNNFVAAESRVEKETVVVSHPDIKEPIAVRYGWSNAPDINLVEANDLPACAFRTDDFEMPEKQPSRNYWEQN